MNKTDLLKRGKEIFTELEAIAGDYSQNTEKRLWASSIVQSVTTGYDTPLDKDEVCIALAKAEQLGKTVTIEPDDDFTGTHDGTVLEQCDGWTYHIVMK